MKYQEKEFVCILHSGEGCFFRIANRVCTKRADCEFKRNTIQAWRNGRLNPSYIYEKREEDQKV